MQKDEKLMQFLEKGITNKIGEKVVQMQHWKIVNTTYAKDKKLKQKKFRNFFYMRQSYLSYIYNFSWTTTFSD